MRPEGRGLRGRAARLRAAYARPVGATLVILALIGAAEAFARWHATTHVAPAVVRQVHATGHVDVVVRLGFRPELFHTVFFQKLGRLTGVEGQRVVLRDVGPSGVRRLGRQYWVESVDLLAP